MVQVNNVCTFLSFPFTGSLSVNTPGCSFLHGINNVIAGPRSYRYQSEQKVTQVVITYDFGSPVTVDHLFISNVAYTETSGVQSIFLESSPDNIIWSSVKQYFLPVTLTGPDDRDLLDFFSPAPSVRYYRLAFNAAVPIQIPVGKTFLGPLFNLGVNLDSKLTENIEFSSRAGQRWTDGRIQTRRTSRPRMLFKLQWTGLKDLTCGTFATTIVNPTNYNMLLINEDLPNILNSADVIYGVGSNIELEHVEEDYSSLKLDFLELLG